MTPVILFCRLISTSEDFDALVGALERRGAREGLLCASLMRCRDAITRAMPAGGWIQTPRTLLPAVLFLSTGAVGAGALQGML